MSTPKVGDRVRVTAEGVVDHVLLADGTLSVVWADGNDPKRRPEGPVVLWVRPEHCEALAPLIEVGDVVTAENVQQLGDKSVAAHDNKEPRRLHVIHQDGVTERRWFYHGSPSGDFDHEMIGAVVLRIGGTS